MSLQPIDVYIYTDRASGLVVFAKKTRGLDLFFEGSDFSCHRIRSETLVCPAPLTQRYAPSLGFHDLAEPINQQRHEVTRKKITILSGVKSNVELVKHNIRTTLTSDYAESVVFSTKDFAVVNTFIEGECQLQLGRVDRFWRTFCAAMDECSSIEQVESQFKDLRETTSTGFFSNLSSSQTREARFSLGE